VKNDIPRPRTSIAIDCKNLTWLARAPVLRSFHRGNHVLDRGRRLGQIVPITEGAGRPDRRRGMVIGFHPAATGAGR